jgi:hypothetical protein
MHSKLGIMPCYVNAMATPHKYYVHWKDYPIEARSWEPAADIAKDVPDLVKEFHEKHPSVPRKINNIELMNFQPLVNATRKDLNNKRTTPWEMGLVHRDAVP